MKEILNFLSWQWNQWEFWQKCFIVSSFFLGAGLAAPEAVRSYLIAIPLIVITAFLAKWLVWDVSKTQWEKYKKEKYELFDNIKNSERYK